MAFACSLQSLMVRQALALKDRFVTTHPHDWLVWEPGAWKVPASGEKLAETQHAPSQPYDRPPRGDCLCFELKTAVPAHIKIGRAPENDIVINDATVSREHLALDRAATGWSIAARRPIQVGGRPLEAGATQPLSSGSQVLMGGVTLTFLSPTGFWDRVSAEAKKLK